MARKEKKSYICTLGLEYLITVQLRFMWLAKKDNLMLLNCFYIQFKAFSINLNAQDVNGMT